jgi:hypothetical protein
VDACFYRVLIEVHLNGASFWKGQRLTFVEMGPSAFILLHYAIATRETPELISLLAAA